MSLDPKFLERFADAAVSEGLVDASFTEISSPIGRLVVVQSAVGVCRVAFAEEPTDVVLDQVAKVVGPRIVSSRTETAAVTDELQAYLEGERATFDVPVDMSLIRSGFQRSVLDELVRSVGRGEILTYGQLAARAGNPKAVRATGTALGRNPVPIIVPCHRILPGSGGVGNYGGGADRKRWLLALEGAPLTARG
jgi:methylated-DNA-[protein]-cysteine S-methyltransferase